MIQVVADEEFIILSWTGAGTMGLFINLNGDPVRGTLQWPSHPLSVCSSFLSLHMLFWLTICYSARVPLRHGPIARPNDCGSQRRIAGGCPDSTGATVTFTK